MRVKMYVIGVPSVNHELLRKHVGKLSDTNILKIFEQAADTDC